MYTQFSFTAAPDVPISSEGDLRCSSTKETSNARVGVPYCLRCTGSVCVCNTFTVTQSLHTANMVHLSMVSTCATVERPHE